MQNLKYLHRAVLVLTSYDFEALQLTLNGLDNTLEKEENVIIVLNGKSNYASECVERIARTWTSSRVNCHVVKPLCYGEEPYFAIQEVLSSFSLLQGVKFICKIDDDIIPLKKGWVDELEHTYLGLKEKDQDPLFVTGLINNNAWGFKQIIDLFNKQDEYKEICNHTSTSGTGLVNAGEIATGFLGTIWQYPYLAFWVHQFTSLNIFEFIERTKNLDVCQIDNDIHYSIGCIYFSKDDWLQLDYKEENCTFDELLLHRYCIKHSKTKWAVLSQPMVHIFYYNQRLSNRDILPAIERSIKSYFTDSWFEVAKYNVEERIIGLVEMIASLEAKIDNISNTQHYKTPITLSNKIRGESFFNIKKIISLINKVIFRRK